MFSWLSESSRAASLSILADEKNKHKTLKMKSLNKNDDFLKRANLSARPGPSRVAKLNML